MKSNRSPCRSAGRETSDIRSGSSRLFITSDVPACAWSARVMTVPPVAPSLKPPNSKFRGKRLECRVDGVDPQLLSVRAHGRAQVRFLQMPGKLRRTLDTKRVGAGGSRVHLLRVVGRRFVYPAGAGYQEAGAAAIGKIRAIGDLHQVGVSMHQVQEAGNTQRVAKRLEHAAIEAEVARGRIPLGHPDANVLASAVGSDPIPKLPETAFLSDDVIDLVEMGAEIIEDSSARRN